MPAPYCLLCDSTNVVMDGSGLFVCADCGARYTVEAMRGIVFPDRRGAKPANDETGDTTPLVPSIWPRGYGSPEEDLIVSNYEAGNYGSVCSVYDGIEDKSRVRAWPMLLASLSSYITSDHRYFSGTSTYGYYRRRAERDIIDQIAKGKQAVIAMYQCELVGCAIAYSLYESLKSIRRYGRDMMADVPITLSHSKIGFPVDPSLFEGVTRRPRNPDGIDLLPSGLDRDCWDILMAVGDAVVEAIDHIHDCVQRGYIPNDEEWAKIEQASRLVMDEHKALQVSSQMDFIAKVVARFK